MAYLWLNTACAPRGIAIVDSAKVRLARWWSEPRQDSRQIFATLAEWAGTADVQSVAAKLDLKALGVEGIVVVQGPGNFTGLRVGITVANALAYAQGLPLRAVPTARFLWACFPGRTGFVWPAGLNQQFYSKAVGEVVVRDSLGAGQEAGAQAKKGPAVVDDLTSAEAERNLPKAVAQLVSEVKPQVQVEPIYLKPAGITQPKPKVG